MVVEFPTENRLREHSFIRVALTGMLTLGLAAVIATGPTGAAVLVTMYALGSTGFLIWVSSRC